MPNRETLSTPPHTRRVEISASCTMPSVFDPLFAVRSTKPYQAGLQVSGGIYPEVSS
jgi:hypothetical protein